MDEPIAIRACKGGMAEAKAAIMEQFSFDDPQADAIVKLQLGPSRRSGDLKIEARAGLVCTSRSKTEGYLADDARAALSKAGEDIAGHEKRFGDERCTEIQSVARRITRI